MRKIKRILSLLLVVAVLISLAACGTAKPADTVLVIGVPASFEEKWNPFLVESAFDHQIMDQIFMSIQTLNEKNEMTDYAGSVTAENTDDGGVLYTVTLNKGMTFTDGKKVTIDDYIWSLYVRADPSYTGLSALTGVSCYIEGINEYYYDDPNYSTKLAEIEAEAEANWTEDTISLENFMIYAEDTSLDGWWGGDPEGDIGNGMTFVEYLTDYGYADEVAAIDTTDADAVFALLAEFEWEFCVGDYDTHAWYIEYASAEYALGNLEEGVTVSEISGIKKINDYSCTIKYTEIAIYADRDLFSKNGAGTLIPKHYYGELVKGDTASIVSNMEPMGSGPYIWGGFADNIATCTANTKFFLGVPKTGTVRWQYIPEDSIIEALVSNQVDIAVPQSTNDNIALLEAGSCLYDLTDNAGYGYMGFNHNNMSQNVRKGIVSLMNRAPAIEGWYGDLATVIERPMTTTVGEYPTDAEEYYGYSREKALEYFMADGYTQVNGKLVDSSGNQLVVNAYVGGSGTGNHPSYAILGQAAEDMAALGGELQVMDVNFNVLQAAMNDGTADIFCLAWSDVNTCDKWTQFHTQGTQNRFNVSDARLDALLDQINLTVNFAERKALVAEMLDLAMDLVIEFPVYQRCNMIAYNPTNLNMDTIPEAGTYYNYENVLWQVEMIQG